MEQIDRVALNVVAIERVDGDQRDLSVCLLIDLGADVRDLRSRRLIDDVRKVVDIARGLEVFDVLSKDARGDDRDEEQRDDEESMTSAPAHSEIVQERAILNFPRE